jgi:hypothetical protein
MEVAVNEIRGFKKNCGLVALQLASGKSDAEVIAAAVATARAYRWKPGRGMYLGHVVEAFAALGVTGREMDSKETDEPLKKGRERPRSSGFGWHNKNRWWHKVTVSGFAVYYPFGTYVVMVPGHLLVMRDGKMLDPNVPRGTRRRRVIAALQVT